MYYCGLNIACLTALYCSDPDDSTAADLVAAASAHLSHCCIRHRHRLLAIIAGNRCLPMLTVIFSYVQDLRSSAQAYQLPSQAQQNLAGNPSDLSTAYTVYPHTDMHNALDLRPAAAPCCVPGAANASAVQTCAASKGLCCVTLADLGVNAVRQQSCSCFTQAACSS